MIKKLFILFTVIAGTLLSVHAQDIPEPMTPKRIVNDFTGLFSTQERAALEKKLVNFNNNSSTQRARHQRLRCPSRGKMGYRTKGKRQRYCHSD